MPITAAAHPFDTAERRDLRAMVRRFAEQEVMPHLENWEREGELPRSLHRLAGDLGLIGLSFPESVGGGGGDIVDMMVVIEELHYAGASGGLIASLLTAGIAVPHIATAADPDQVERWVRPTLAGELELVGQDQASRLGRTADVDGARLSFDVAPLS